MFAYWNNSISKLFLRWHSDIYNLAMDVCTYVWYCLVAKWMIGYISYILHCFVLYYFITCHVMQLYVLGDTRVTVLILGCYYVRHLRLLHGYPLTPLDHPHFSFWVVVFLLPQVRVGVDDQLTEPNKHSKHLWLTKCNRTKSNQYEPIRTFLRLINWSTERPTFYTINIIFLMCGR